jgi:hypothetical protein
VSFPSVFEPSSYQGGPEKYSVCAVFEPDKFSPAEKKRYADMLALADEAAKDFFGKPLNKLPANHKRPLRDGEEKGDLQGFGAGKMFCTISSKQRPGIVAADNVTPIVDSEDFYPGCYARATITAYAYDNVGKGVAFGLQNLKFVRDGERLDSRTDAADDFADLGEEDMDGAAAADDDLAG